MTGGGGVSQMSFQCRRGAGVPGVFADLGTGVGWQAQNHSSLYGALAEGPDSFSTPSSPGRRDGWGSRNLARPGRLPGAGRLRSGCAGV